MTPQLRNGVPVLLILGSLLAAAIRTTRATEQVVQPPPTPLPWAKQLPPNTEVHVVGVYEGSLPPGVVECEEVITDDPKVVAAADECHRGLADVPRKVDVRVLPREAPIVLVLTAYEPVHWNLLLEGGEDIRGIILSGMNEQRVQGVGKDVHVQTYFPEQFEQGVRERQSPAEQSSPTVEDIAEDSLALLETCPLPASGSSVEALETWGECNELLVDKPDYFFAYEQNSFRYQYLEQKVSSLLGRPLTTFQGAYIGSVFTTEPSVPRTLEPKPAPARPPLSSRPPFSSARILLFAGASIALIALMALVLILVFRRKST